MAERSEEQIIDRLFELENTGLADRRAELTGERFLSLIHDPDSGRAYVFQHGLDDTEGAEVPEGTEFWEYDSPEQAERVYEQLLTEARQAGALVDEDTEEGLGDQEVAGAELRDVYAADDDDSLVVDAEDEPSEP